ncbi:holliday junction resolvase [Xanthomonas virus PB119]|nr:holliday junction resolvase [Xanthomonas virus PB119]
MKIPVLGMDPSLRNWGLAEATLCLDTGILSTPVLSTIHTSADDSKQVRQNSKDLQTAEELAKGALAAARRAKVVFVEVPVGSQSARAMASYGTCVGVLGAIRAEGIPLIEVTPLEVKTHFTGKKTATKEEMIKAALTFYPDANWPRHKGKVVAKAEHMADAVASIHAGVHTPVFQQLMRLFAS